MNLDTFRNIMNKYTEKLKKLPRKKLEKVLKLHDEFFNSWEDFPEEREVLKNDMSTESIIEWIMGTDPVMTEGGLVDFLANTAKI